MPASRLPEFAPNRPCDYGPGHVRGTANHINSSPISRHSKHTPPRIPR